MLRCAGHGDADAPVVLPAGPVGRAGDVAELFLGVENRHDGVRVTNLVVGAVDSPFWEHAGGTELARDRMLKPEDVARAIVQAAAQPAATSIDEIVLMPPDGVL